MRYNAYKNLYYPLWGNTQLFDFSVYVKVIYDIYHQQITEGNIIPTVTSNLEYIAHLHAAGHPGRHEPWLGENDYRVIIDAIDKAGYTGFMGLEYFPTIDALESLKRAKEIFE